MLRRRRPGEAPGAGEDFPITATPAQVTAARDRLMTAAEGAAKTSKLSVFEAVPRFREAIDKLPDLRPLLLLAPELRAPVLDALVDAGATVPRETWSRLGVSWLYRERIQA